MSFNYAAAAATNVDNSYVLDVAAAPSLPLLAAACSSGAVRVFYVDLAGGLKAHGGGGPGGAGKNAMGSASSSSQAPAAHSKPATALAWHSTAPSLLSASKDGTVACWDVRLNGGGGGGAFSPPALRLQAREPLHSVCFVEESRSVPSSPAPPSAPTTSTSALVAAGGDGKIFLWDARTGRELAVFEDTHDGDVTSLVRAPLRPTIRAGDGSLRTSESGSSGSACFLSAGVDGLVAVWDVSLSNDFANVSSPSNENEEEEAKTPEDEAFVTALNTSTSLSRVGLCCSSHSSPLDNSSSLHLWATTGVEGLLTWDWGAACDEADAEGGLGPSSLAADARGELLGAQKNKKNKGNKGPSSSSSSSSSSSFDYVVGCVAVAESAPSSSSVLLLLAAGDHSGRLALFPLGPPAARGGVPTLLGSSSSSSSSPTMSVPAGNNRATGKPYRGHSATVRALCVAAPGGGGRALATGGEDGLVVLWTPSGFGGASGGGRGNDDEDSEDEGDGDDDAAAAQRGEGDSSRLGVRAAADGVVKKKKKRRHKQNKKGNKKGLGGDGGGGDGGGAEEMSVE